jgi:hypothetical protein
VILNTSEAEDHLQDECGGPEYGVADQVPVPAWTLILLKRIAWRPRP